MKWLQIDNSTGTETLKQHCFIPATRKVPYIGEKYEGNRTLCSKRKGCADEDERYVMYDNLESETLNEAFACKTCLKIYKNNV